MRQEGRSPCGGGHPGLAPEQRPEGTGWASGLTLTGIGGPRWSCRRRMERWVRAQLQAGGGWRGGLEPSFRGLMPAAPAWACRQQCSQCLLRAGRCWGLSLEAPERRVSVFLLYR